MGTPQGSQHFRDDSISVPLYANDSEISIHKYRKRQKLPAIHMNIYMNISFNARLPFQLMNL